MHPASTCLDTKSCPKIQEAFLKLWAILINVSLMPLLDKNAISSMTLPFDKLFWQIRHAASLCKCLNYVNNHRLCNLYLSGDILNKFTMISTLNDKFSNCYFISLFALYNWMAPKVIYTNISYFTLTRQSILGVIVCLNIAKPYSPQIHFLTSFL